VIRVEPSQAIHVGTYERAVHASLPRVWENVHDWEHLPWLHRSTFCSIELLGSGDWGWRALVGLQPAEARREIEIELRVEAEDRYVVRTLAGEGEGTEIRTILATRGVDDTDARVEFRVPGVASQQVEGLGAAFKSLYAQLWDEDESMIRLRSDRLARRGGPSARDRGRVALGTLGKLPRIVEAHGRHYRIVELEGEVYAHTTVCPHRLGPLEDAEIGGAALVCPWHGYRFDLRTGCNLDGHRLRLPPSPRVEQDASQSAWLVFDRGEEEETR
jgi:nitrite reductase/ring-hydroxylating ferredoxin subunit